MAAISISNRVLWLYEIFHAAEVVTRDSIFYTRTYGPTGMFLAFYGSRSIWQLQAEVINLNDENVAFNLKKLVQDESQIVAVAASIIVQIAITALSLDGLSQAHWTARGFFVLSLVSATMAVYSASNQYRIFCRCVSAEHIKQWVTAFTMADHFMSFMAERLPTFKMTSGKIGPAPPVASVIIVSAPFALLVLALHSFLIGFGIWLGYVWTRNLDPDAAPGGSRAVFITYAVGLGTCYTIYTLTNLYGGSQKPLSKWVDELEQRILHELRSKTARPDRDSEQGVFVQQPRSIATQPTDPSTISTSWTGSFNEEISNSLRQTARLRRELAETEERLADLYKRHTQQPQ
ncbi:hypothetical protein F5Y01DRAFT_313868 [Xylaria sp. FL0043]|nr:hypothetical protein F5Y01DRAFT_313868 [Xylaria sp. FL0043]